jgi:hypothetical protein
LDILLPTGNWHQPWANDVSDKTLQQGMRLVELADHAVCFMREGKAFGLMQTGTNARLKIDR